MRSVRVCFGMIALSLLARTPVLAHMGSVSGGFVGGLAHPVFGPDHVLAMVAVGLWESLGLPRSSSCPFLPPSHRWERLVFAPGVRLSHSSAPRSCILTMSDTGANQTPTRLS
jgi:HupE / UreJ protein